ncbi:hypothetical protein D910_02608, partial [Dendroctonus ponderosae]
MAFNEELFISEPSQNEPPRLIPVEFSSFIAYEETDIHLTCTAQGNPPPNYGWFRDVRGNLQPLVISSRVQPSQDVLEIRNLMAEDSGRWTCKVFNSFGEQRVDIHLNVVAHLTVHILPQLQIANSGQNVIFNCTVVGTPIGRIQWVKNGEPIVPDDHGKFKLLDPLVLQVADVTRHDKGMYQCMVENDKENAQGSAELRLGDTRPEMHTNFVQQAVQPGVQVSLRCSAIGFPPPQFKWLLDGQPFADLKPDHRYAISQYMDYTGDVIAHLNITSVRVEDGGLYTCRASNKMGFVEHSARLNVYGRPNIRSIGPAKAVAGTDAMLHCPYSGYPIQSVRWERHGQELPQDMRHRLEEGGALTIMKVDQNTDKGFYTCYVTSREGLVARKEIQLIVNAPPVMEPFNFPTSIQEGGRAQVTCTVTSGDLPIRFLWYKDEEPIPASLEVQERAAEFYSMLVFKNLNSRHTGTYTCVASNAAAQVNYTAQLMVKVAPQWTIEPQDISALLGDSVLMPCLAKGFPEPTISWLRGHGKSTDYRPISGVHRVIQLGNGSLWFEAVTSEDEGNYLCRANNGIGSGLGKVIYFAVKEPVRFDIPYRNVSVKRGEETNLLCHVHGDDPIAVKWIFNETSLDLHKLSKTDREDSGTYKCLAENDFGQSEYVVNLVVQEKPDPPSGLEAVEKDALIITEITGQAMGRAVKLSWIKPFDGNSPLIGYIVQYKMLGLHSTWEESQILNLTSSAAARPERSVEQAVLRGLKPATVYTIRISAVNGLDKSDFTETIVIKTQEEKPRGAPTDVKVEAVSSTELSVQWSPPSRSSWNGELLGYKINWKEHHGFINQTKNDTVHGWATTKFILSGLKKFTTYDILIKAFNRMGSGPPSPNIIGTTKEGIPEAPPQNLMCSEITSQMMKISWTTPPQHLHGGLIQGYKIFYKPMERTHSTNTYIHGLQKFTNYSIKVLAFTSAGDGVVSDVLLCSTEEDVPGKPANIKANALTGESILVSWLPPLKRNGLITLYTIYCREAGRVGQHKIYNIRIEAINEDFGLFYEVRNLTEHQLYEFWVSATTKVGEGESTAITAQQTNSRAPSKIASFSQTLHQPNKSRMMLPCIAVGNPKPRTRWTHQNKPITFSNFYAVTVDGHLHIHDVDLSMTGNYTCKAVNLFGEDSITYSLIVLMPPTAPKVKIEYTTTNSIKIKWTKPDSGGSEIEGYILNIKDEKTDWVRIDVSPEVLQYAIENLKCGTSFYLYVAAQTRLTFCITGGPPLLPKEDQIFAANSSMITANLKNWPNGGCTISKFSVDYKTYSIDKWHLIAENIKENEIVIHDLMPGTWYQIRVIAENDAGVVRGFFNVATLSIDGRNYEISPYATFVVPASNNSHSVKTPVDYTMQFKTFSHIEDGEHSKIIIPKAQPGKGTWHKNQHYYNNDYSRELSEAECDRDLKLAEIISSELNDILSSLTQANPE